MATFRRGLKLALTFTYLHNGLAKSYQRIRATRRPSQHCVAHCVRSRVRTTVATTSATLSGGSSGKTRRRGLSSERLKRSRATGAISRGSVSSGTRRIA